MKRPPRRQSARPKKARKKAKVRAVQPAAPPFEISLLGGAVERRYRFLRPEIEKLPWGTLRADRIDDELRQVARAYWFDASVNEYMSAAVVTDAVSSLVYAQVPLDLSSMASRFIMDELSHAEIAARVVAELGDGPPLQYDPSPLMPAPPMQWRPLLRAAYYMMRGFCTGEAYSLAMARVAADLDTDPMISAVLQRIAKDEAAHGSFGWIFFDWAGDRFSKAERKLLREVAELGVSEIDEIIAGCEDADDGPTLGWLSPAAVKRASIVARDHDVVAPLRARGYL